MNNKKARVLIVDDSKLQRAILREMLKESFDITEAETGEECIEIIKKAEDFIDIVLLDLIMPGMDGLEVLRRRQEIESFADIPVIVLTMSDKNETQVEAFELGADDFIIKPVESEIAISRINNVLDSRRRLNLLIKNQKELRIRAEIDEMTHLYNKTATEKNIGDALINFPDTLHAMMVIDIDNFKAVNDMWGHKVGDHTISVVAGIIASQFDKTDIVGRVGGDEFVVFMGKSSSKQDAREKASTIINLIKNKENLSIPEQITISVGLSFTDSENENYVTLFKKADEALYNSKKAGKGCYTEYGEEGIRDGDSKTVLLFRGSRNVFSILEYIYRHPVMVERVSSIDDIDDYMAEMKERVITVYLDMSESDGNDDIIWEYLRKRPWVGTVPVVALCREGNLCQMKNAVTSGVITDMLLTPLEPEQIKRRIKEYSRSI